MSASYCVFSIILLVALVEAILLLISLLPDSWQLLRYSIIAAVSLGALILACTAFFSSLLIFRTFFQQWALLRRVEQILQIALHSHNTINASGTFKRTQLSAFPDEFWDRHTILHTLKLFLLSMNYLPAAAVTTVQHDRSAGLLPRMDSFAESSLTASTTTIKQAVGAAGAWDRMIREYSFTSVQEWDLSEVASVGAFEPLPGALVLPAEPSSPEYCSLKRLETTVLRIHLGALSSRAIRSAPNEAHDLYSTFVPLICDIIARYKGSITSLCASYIEIVWPVDMEKKSEVLQVCECVFEMRRHLAKQRQGAIFRDSVIFTMLTCESLFGPLEMRQMSAGTNSGSSPIPGALPQHLLHRDYILTTDYCHEMHHVLRFMARNSKSFLTMDYRSYLLCSRKFVCRQLDYIRLDHSSEKECIFDCIAKKNINETQEWFYLLKSEQQEDTWRVYNLAWKQITLGRYNLAQKALSEFEKEVESRGTMLCSEEHQVKESVRFLRGIIQEGLERQAKGEESWQYVRSIVSFSTESERFFVAG